MDYDVQALISYRIGRTRSCVEEARYAIDTGKLHLAENRNYYACFYIVSALALKFGFSTSKHRQLLGWFNHNIINEGIAEQSLGKIYRKAFERRQESDYDDFIVLDIEDVTGHYYDMLKFVSEIEVLINKE